MTEVAVEIPPDGGVSPAVESAHAAAVAEGAADVRAGDAQEAAGEAKAAAEVALSAAAANMEAGLAVAEATETAVDAAAQARADAAMIRDALTAQTGAINALADEFRASRKSTAPSTPPSRSAPDREPGGGQKLVRR